VEGVCLHGMAVDVPYGDICAADESERKIAVAQNMVYVPVAQRLGLAYFRINTGGDNPPTPRQIEQAIRSLKELTDVAWNCGVRIAFENHGGLSLSTAGVIQIIEAVGRDRMATLPDIGNFGKGEDAYEKIAQIVPYAVAIHAKVYNFDEAGEAGNIDFKRMAAAVSGAGFRGTWSIETNAPDAWHTNEAVLKSKALLQKYLA
jgi:sugar phosphate isomerase/epimerase